MAGPPGPQLVHMKVFVSGVINTSVTLLWDLVRDYGQAHTWFGTYRGVKTFTTLLPGQINCQVGAMRSVMVGHYGFVDQLDALDDERYIMKYKLISHPQNTNPFPGAFLNFKANIQLKEITRGQASYMQWTGEFDTDPQDCEIMRQSIEELFEAGFQELENLVAPPPPVHPMYHHGGQPGPPMGVVGEGQMGHLQHGLGSINLNPSEGLPANFGPLSGTSFPPPRSPRGGPSSMASEPAPATAHSREKAAHDSGSMASSPQTNDGTGARPGSGGPMLNQWTSGGSNSTINLSTLPGRRSGEDVEAGYSRRHTRNRTTQEGIPEGKPYVEAPALPAAFRDQVNQRQGTGMPPPDSYARYNQDHARQAGHSMHPDLPQRDSLGSVSDQGGDLHYQHHMGHSDPLLQEREEYKASLLANQQFQRISKHPSDASLQSANLAHETASEPDWSRVMHGRDEAAALSACNSQVSSPHVQSSEASRSHQEWVRHMQQREAELHHREEMQHRRKGSPSGPIVGSGFGVGGPFGAASAKGGPFAAASGLPPRDSAHVRRSTSQQSLASLLSAGGSGQLDRSAGSVVDEAGLQAQRPGIPRHQRGGTADYQSADRARNDPRSMWPSG